MPRASSSRRSSRRKARSRARSSAPKANGSRRSSRPRAKAIDTVFRAIHEGKPDPQLLAYQYVQALPEIAHGEANKVWIIPSEFAQALSHLGGALGGPSSNEK